ncbi:MAG: hypothetical protein HQM16_17645 [Deltaproteobacteria bacterium]|nr:hypothetical protein [Deltaproteobacteria bacterium]
MIPLLSAVRQTPVKAFLTGVVWDGAEVVLRRVGGVLEAFVAEWQFDESTGFYLMGCCVQNKEPITASNFNNVLRFKINELVNQECSITEITDHIFKMIEDHLAIAQKLRLPTDRESIEKFVVVPYVRDIYSVLGLEWPED